MLYIALNLIIVLVIPALIGVTVCELLSMRKSFASCILFGTFLVWAAIQLIAVPLILLECNFIIVVIITTVVTLVPAAYGVRWIVDNAHSLAPNIQGKLAASDVFAIALLVIGSIALMYAMASITFEDFDDSRFVVEAIDMVRTNRMLLTNPATGREINSFAGELVKDVTSPWSVYIAYISKVTGTQASIVAHTVLRFSLTLCLMCAYWETANTFFGKSIFSKCAFTFLAMLVNVFGAYTGWNAEAFIMTRIWQGKAVVAGIGITTLYLTFAHIYAHPRSWKPYSLLYVVTLGACLMSGMGIIISALMCGAASLVYGYLKRSLPVAMKISLAVLIPACYYCCNTILCNTLL